MVAQTPSAMKLITRRKALALGLSSAGAASLPLGGCDAKPGPHVFDAELERQPPLSRRAAKKGVLYGAAALSQHVTESQAYAAAFARECGVLVSQNELKWRALRPSPETYRFTGADRLFSFARAHELAFRGHCLVWHIDNPPWLAEALNSQKPAKLLEDHIWNVVGRYRGRTHSWDVVNEAIRVRDGREDGLRDTVWLSSLGPSYIERAFRIAAAADPSAILVYNDFDLEFADRGATRKRLAVQRLLERLKGKGVPVHALGIQAHLEPSYPFDARILTEILDWAAGLGLRVFITELDVDDHRLPRNIKRRDQAVADTYRAYLDTALAHPAAALVATWGLGDKFSWLNDPYFRRTAWTARPLPLDVYLHRKPAWAAMAQAFDNAPPRAPMPHRTSAQAPMPGPGEAPSTNT
jgi:endo-1,4-beta-xylanase